VPRLVGVNLGSHVGVEGSPPEEPFGVTTSGDKYIGPPLPRCQLLEPLVADSLVDMDMLTARSCPRRLAMREAGGCDSCSW
jgi:hypothetical protein